jgi:hypothetical protein
MTTKKNRKKKDQSGAWWCRYSILWEAEAEESQA